MIHIRNGEDILPHLRALDRGPAVSWDDPVCLGPLIRPEATPEWYDLRSEFLSKFGSRETIRTKLVAQDRALEDAFEHDEIVLWFEADLYCQAVMVRLLAQLAERPGVIDRTRLVCIGDHPTIERFIGLGQLGQAEIAKLFETRQPITEEEVGLAERAWAAFRAPEPEALNDLLLADTSVLPFLGAALYRFAREYAAVEDGLSLTERLALQVMADGIDSPGPLFAELQQRESVPWMGDLMLWPVLEGLDPLLALDGPSGWYNSRDGLQATTLRLTDHGRAVLSGDESRTPPARWLGGVEIGPGKPNWRWDEASGRVTLV